MRLKTIWTMPAMSFVERLRRTRDKAFCDFAYILPRRLKYWVTIHNINYVAYKTGGVVGSITVDELMKTMPAPKDMH
jgi:hypothetical protein